MKMNSKRKRIVLLQNGETLKNKLKHLLIIFISLLLLSSPVFGDNHKGETLYGWGKTLPYVWKGFGDKKTHPMYHGGVENGVPSGLGILILPNGNKYVGGWEDGRRNGQGTFTTSNGSKYEGEWKNGESHGQGHHRQSLWRQGLHFQAFVSGALAQRRPAHYGHPKEHEELSDAGH